MCWIRRELQRNLRFLPSVYLILESVIQHWDFVLSFYNHTPGDVTAVLVSRNPSRLCKKKREEKLATLSFSVFLFYYAKFIITTSVTRCKWLSAVKYTAGLKTSVYLLLHTVSCQHQYSNWKRTENNEITCSFNISVSNFSLLTQKKRIQKTISKIFFNRDVHYFTLFYTYFLFQSTWSDFTPTECLNDIVNMKL